MSLRCSCSISWHPCWTEFWAGRFYFQYLKDAGPLVFGFSPLWRKLFLLLPGFGSNYVYVRFWILFHKQVHWYFFTLLFLFWYWAHLQNVLDITFYLILTLAFSVSDICFVVSIFINFNPSFIWPFLYLGHLGFLSIDCFLFTCVKYLNHMLDIIHIILFSLWILLGMLILLP